MKETKNISASSYNLRRNSCCFKNLASCFRSNSVDTDCQKDLSKIDLGFKNSNSKGSFSNCCNSENKKIDLQPNKDVIARQKSPSNSLTSVKTDIGKLKF